MTGPEGERMLEVRHAVSPQESARFTSQERRAAFLIDDLFGASEVRLVYSHEDRMIAGGASPEPGQPLALGCPAQLRSATFCERREVGIVNVGGPGRVRAGHESYPLGPYDCLYAGKGIGPIVFDSDGKDRARFYLVSTPAHARYPTTIIREGEVAGEDLGGPGSASVRTLRKYIHAAGVRSCELVMGLTKIAAGSVWNTMPPHTHERRTEIYLYCDVPDGARVVHLMGEPHEVRALVVADGQAVIAPSWSVHCGAGTSAYTFVWAMGGENQAFDDMDAVSISDLR